MVDAEDPQLPEILQDLKALLAEHSVLTLATHNSDGPYSTPLFYAADLDQWRLVFVSDPHSQHCQDLQRDTTVSAAIYHETEIPEAIRGVQLRGSASILSPADQPRERERYLGRFPWAVTFLERAPQEQFYEIRMGWAKYTDNRRKFGFKRTLWLDPLPERLDKV